MCVIVRPDGHTQVFPKPCVAHQRNSVLFEARFGDTRNDHCDAISTVTLHDRFGNNVSGDARNAAGEEVNLPMTFALGRDNGNECGVFPAPEYGQFEQDDADVNGYLKKHTEALVKDVGIEAACKLTGKSKATLGRYYSLDDEHSDRYMPVDAVSALEAAASYPHVTAALAELRGSTLENINSGRNSTSGSGGINSDVITLSQRFAMLMGEYNLSIEDGVISINEAKRLLRETLELQKILVDMKLHLEDETA